MVAHNGSHNNEQLATGYCEKQFRALQAAQERFRGNRDTVARLFNDDDSFHELCVDYMECVESERRFAAAGAPAEALHKEYVALKLDLECAILRYIGQFEGLA